MCIVFLFVLVDCEWGEWAIGECSVTCGGGIQIDVRSTSQEELFGGNTCYGDATRQMECNTNACPGITFINEICTNPFLIISALNK